MALSVALISQHLKILSGFSCCFLETASAPHSAFLDPESSQVASGSSGPFEESPHGNLPRMKLLASYIAPISGAELSATKGGERQNRLHLESRTPSWAVLWTLSDIPSIYGNDKPSWKTRPPRRKRPRAHT